MLKHRWWEERERERERCSLIALIKKEVRFYLICAYLSLSSLILSHLPLYA
jgi:hypothetical protein